jgi:hypothetical protein
MLHDPNAHFDAAGAAYRAEFGEVGPADIKDEALTEFFRDSSPEHWLDYLKRHFRDKPVAQMNFLAAALAAAQRGPAEGTAPEWWQHAAAAGRTVASLLWQLRHGNRYEGSDLGKWFPADQNDADAMLRKLSLLSNAAWRLLRLIVHYGGFHETETGLHFDTLSLMARDVCVAAYYSVVYNQRGPLFPLPGANHCEAGGSAATRKLYPRHSYHAELISWLCSFNPSAADPLSHFIDIARPQAEDVLYAEGIRPIVVDYWGGWLAEHYDHTRIHNKGSVRSLQFTNYPFLDRLNLAAEGYVNLVEIFVDGVVTALPQGATDGRVRVILGVRPTAVSE